MRKRKNKVFFDSSVLIAASISPTGKSRHLLNLSKMKRIEGITSDYAFEEVKRSLFKKLPEALPVLYRILRESNLKILPYPKRQLVKKCEKIIKDKNDAPILASAIEAKVGFLITFNRKHFLNDENLKSKVPFKILKPEELQLK